MKDFYWLTSESVTNHFLQRWLSGKEQPVVRRAADMSLYLLFFLAGGFCQRHDDIPTVTAMLNTMATLPCPHATGDVTWRRYINGNAVALVTIKNGAETKSSKRYGSLADNSLVIRNVTSYDISMYFCNERKVYLKETTDTSKVVLHAGNVADSGPDQNQTPSDFWRVPTGVAVGVAVGIVVGAVAVLLVTFTLRLCCKKGTEGSANVVEAGTELIYEEIKKEQPRRDSYFESPYSWAGIGPTPPDEPLYSTVDKPAAAGRSGEECVYSFAQHPPQTGNGNE